MTPPPAPGEPALGASAPQGLRTLSRGTLSRQLVVRVKALVALIAIALSSLTALATHLILRQQLDQQLTGRVMLTTRDEEPWRGSAVRDCSRGSSSMPARLAGRRTAGSRPGHRPSRRRSTAGSQEHHIGATAAHDDMGA